MQQIFLEEDYAPSIQCPKWFHCAFYQYMMSVQPAVAKIVYLPFSMAYAKIDR